MNTELRMRVVSFAAVMCLVLLSTGALQGLLALGQTSPPSPVPPATPPPPAIMFAPPPLQIVKSEPISIPVVQPLINPITQKYTPFRVTSLNDNNTNVTVNYQYTNITEIPLDKMVTSFVRVIAVFMVLLAAVYFYDARKRKRKMK